MSINLRVSVAPALEPINIDDVKAHLRLDSDDDYATLELFIKAAREKCEEVARRSFITKTYELRLGRWPAAAGLDLARGPVQSITSIKYTDEDGLENTLSAANYVLYGNTEPPIVMLKPTASWPTAVLMPGWPIVITYVAGYGAKSTDVPAQYRQAMLLLVGHWYENREGVGLVQGAVPTIMPWGIEALLLADRETWF